jgi:CRP/FNR family cyclic AMP-dependent transcriptional regulator
MHNLNLIDKAFLLKKSSLFHSLDLDLLLSIADKMETLHFRSFENVFQTDQEAYRMYLIISGQITAIDKTGTQLAELSTGDFFGDEAMFNEKKRTYATLCKTRVELLSLSRSHLISIIQECPSVALSLLESYTMNLLFRARN